MTADRSPCGQTFAFVLDAHCPWEWTRASTSRGTYVSEPHGVAFLGIRFRGPARRGAEVTCSPSRPRAPAPDDELSATTQHLSRQHFRKWGSFAEQTDPSEIRRCGPDRAAEEDRPHRRRLPRRRRSTTSPAPACSGSRSVTGPVRPQWASTSSTPSIRTRRPRRRLLLRPSPARWSSTTDPAERSTVGGARTGAAHRGHRWAQPGNPPAPRARTRQFPAHGPRIESVPVVGASATGRIRPRRRDPADRTGERCDL